MFCEPKTLVRALANYRAYEPTASEHLRVPRAVDTCMRQTPR